MDPTTPVSAIMNRSVAKVRPDARLAEAARLMRELHVSGLPVQNASGELVGMLSEKDLVRDLHHATGVASPRGILDLLLESAPAGGPSLLEACRRRLEHGQVHDLMSSPAVSVAPDTPVREVAREMEQRGVHRLPVVDSRGTIVGIVSERDLVAALAGEAAPRSRGGLHPRPARRPTPRNEGDAYGDI